MRDEACAPRRLVLARPERLALFPRQRPIPVVTVEDFRGATDQFYGRYSDCPVIIRDAFAGDPCLGDLTAPRVEALLRGCSLWGYSRDTGEGAYVTAEAVFAGNRGEAPGYNVVDHPVGETPLVEHFRAPAFLSHNWFVDSGFATEWFPASLVVTGKDTFTGLHTDPYGMQGWTYLVYGRKEWEIFDAASIPVLFNEKTLAFFDAERDRLQDYPEAPQANCYNGTTQAGDLLVFPPGWPHQVYTPEEAFGFGGGIVNDFLIDRQMRHWLWERERWGDGSLDFKAFTLALSQARSYDAEGRARADRAIRLCEDWEAARGSSGSGVRVP